MGNYLELGVNKVLKGGALVNCENKVEFQPGFVVAAVDLSPVGLGLRQGLGRAGVKWMGGTGARTRSRVRVGLWVKNWKQIYFPRQNRGVS